jgi:Carboxypeptidase regulatory-like domain
VKTILIALQFVCLTLIGFSQALPPTSIGDSSVTSIESCSSFLASYRSAELLSIRSGRSLMATTGNCAISGTVTGPDGLTPLRGISIWVFKSGVSGLWNYRDETSTDSNGNYKLEGLIPGSYSLRYSESTDGVYGSQLYTNGSLPETAIQIVLVDGATVTGINASLKKLARITGTITGPNGTSPLLSARISAYRSDNLGGWDFVKFAFTNFDGSYSLDSLYPGTYRLNFDGLYGYGNEYYNNVSQLQSAVDIPIVYGAVVSGIDASLVELGKIAGVVTGPNGTTPLDSIHVTIYRFDSTWGWVTEGYAYTDSNGTYETRGLKAGNYRIGFSEAYYKTFKEEFYNNVFNIEAAADIIVSDNTTTSGISGSLTELGRVTGKVTGLDGITPLNNIEVSIYRPNGSAGWKFVRSAYTQFDGSYSLKGLETGVYRIKFSDSYSRIYSDKFYNNAAQIDAATDIAVAESTTTSGINASLAEKGKIVGTVTGPDRVTPLKDIEVMIYRLDRDIGWTSSRSVSTRADGGYSFQGLDAGRYRLRFYDSKNNIYANKYYPGVTTLASATDITVADLAAVGGINISMGDTPSVPIIPIIPVIPIIPPGPVVPLVPVIEVAENGVILGQASTIRFKSPKGKTTTATKYLTIKNVGGVVLTGLKVGKKGPSSASFLISKLTVTSLAPGASATVKVIFKPSAAGNRNATVMISSSDPIKNPFVIQMVGNGKKGVAKNALLISSYSSPSSRFSFSLNSEKIMVSADVTNGLRYQTLTVYKSPFTDASSATVEVSSNLLDWFSGNAHTTVVTDNGTQYKVRDNTAVTDDSKRFIRLKTGVK